MGGGEDRGGAMGAVVAAAADVVAADFGDFAAEDRREVDQGDGGEGRDRNREGEMGKRTWREELEEVWLWRKDL